MLPIISLVVKPTATEVFSLAIRQSGGSALLRELRKNKIVYLLIGIGFLYYLIFHFGPMFGIVMAFQDYSPGRGFLHSEWVGFQNFLDFFNSVYFGRIFKNTILINLYQLLWGFPIPIILALLLNEISCQGFKRFIQTATYFPHFISMVVAAGMIIDFTSTNGLINQIITFFGGTPSNLLMEPSLFRTIYIASGIWQGAGWGSILYIAALSGINPELYEAATIDGAGRFSKIWHVSLPGIMPTVIIMLILQIGSMMNVNFEKIILLYNPITYETADVISSFVYRKGILEGNFSYSAAVGVFNSVINCFLLVAANFISRRMTETSLW